MGLADEISDRTRLPKRGVAPLTEVEQCVDRAAISHLVVEPGKHDVVALTDGSVIVQEKSRHDEEADALDTRRAARDLGQDEVDDVVAELVIAAGDPHLGADEPVRPIVLRCRACGDVGERRAGLWLGQAHRAEEPTFDHRSYVSIDLRRSAIHHQQIRVGDGQEWVRRRSDVRRLQPCETRRGEDVRQLHTADALVHARADESCPRKNVEGALDLRNQLNDSGVKRRLVYIAPPIVCREVIRGDALRELEHGIECRARVLRVALS